MRLLASTDLALRLLMLLAMEPKDHHVSVETAARELGGLSRDNLHKIVQGLAAIGVVRTVRGAGGGVKLAKSPAEIRIGVLIQRLEKDQAIVECFRADGGSCTLTPSCRLRFKLQAAQEGFYQALDQSTLADCMPRSGSRVDVSKPDYAGRSSRAAGVTRQGKVRRGIR